MLAQASGQDQEASAFLDQVCSVFRPFFFVPQPRPSIVELPCRDHYQDTLGFHLSAYTYAFDSLGRPNKLTDNQATPVDWVKDVLYSPGGQMTQMKFIDNSTYSTYFTETRSYNTQQQLTQILTTNYQSITSFNTQYVYSSTQNNGQISQSIDAVSGETVDYAYDSLNRLISAATTGPQWGLSFGYDGFGNRLTQTVTKGSAPASSLTANASTNRISSSGYGYDANGNLTTTPYGAGSMTLTYDVENRLTRAVNSNGTEYYGYSADNRRVFQRLANGTADWIHFHGANGEQLGTYQITGISTFSTVKTNLYFAGRLIRQNGVATFIDRLGSDRKASRYYPYGEEQVVTANDKDKFATYFRDSSTGLDYAMNRYYGSTMGRFLTPDPYGGSPTLARPTSWNRYAYVEGDPVNYNDPSGLYIARPRDEGGSGGGWFDFGIRGSLYDWARNWRPSPLPEPGEPSGGRGPSKGTRFLNSAYANYGQKLNECITAIFGEKASAIPEQTRENAPGLDTTQSGAELSAKLDQQFYAGVIPEGTVDPVKGPNGTVLIASEKFNDLGYTADNFARAFFHELGNILSYKISGNYYDYGDPTGDASIKNGRPWDKDTGAVMENCIFHNFSAGTPSKKP